MTLSDTNFKTINEKYPDLNIIKQDGEYIISGPIQLDHLYGDVRMTGLFELEIRIAEDFPNTFPSVKELTKRIDRGYPHIYSDERFCLATNSELKMYFHKNKDIGLFIDDYVIPYLYTYRYHEEYGVYPFGERSHNICGDLEYFKELFQVDDFKQAFEIVSFIAKNKYRGHLLCPCKSGKRVRKCHGEIIKEIISAGIDDDCKSIVSIIEEVKKEKWKTQLNN